MWRGVLLAVLLPFMAQAAPMRDLSVPMTPVAHYPQARLVGHWYEVAQTPSPLELDCHGTTADVAPREDSRLTLKIACHKGSVTGKVLPIDGIMVETDPGIFQVRLVRLMELGNLQLLVLWQAEDDSMAAIGAPLGQVGWVWSKTAVPDPAQLAVARQALIAAGYRAADIHPVDQAP